MNWFDQVRIWLSSLSTSEDQEEVTRRIRGLVGQTQRFNRTLFALAIIGLAALILARGPLPGEIRFIVWALVGALASAVVGAAFGLLFGLPTVEAKREAIAAANAFGIPNSPPIDPGAPHVPTLTANVAGTPSGEAPTVVTSERVVELGYRDSTSLEQIADWLTKIIVGLTLTQYATWQDHFQILASNLTAAMMGGAPRDALCARITAGLRGQDLLRALDLPACRASAIPGGVIIVLFATTGFLICYLWMRRYFILEMIIARKEAENELKKESARAKDELRLSRQRTEDKLKDAEVAREAKEKARSAAEQQKLIDVAAKAGLAEPEGNRQVINDPKTELNHIFDRAKKRLLPTSPAIKTLARIRAEVEKQVDPDDPWRHKFGQSSVTGFALEASVSAIPNDQQYFRVDLQVRALGPGWASEVEGSRVMYFLHPTFSDQPRISNFSADGIAPLELFAYGAFTVGALLLESGTALELNLATLPDAPQRFLAQ